MAETRLFVGNIPGGTTENELKSEFGYYGTVNSVELKTKNDDNLYGFVNIVIDEKLVQKCIREFGQQKFKGNFLSVSKAKESFLERLKREREQQDRLGDENSIGRKLLEISMKTSKELEETPKNVTKLPQIEKEVSSDDESSSEEEPEVVVKPKVVPVKRVTYEIPVEEPKIVDKAVLDDIKRQQSLQKLIDMQKEQKNAIRNALLSIDSTAPRNNKIVFEKPEPVAINSTSKKPTLFDDDENEEETEVQPDSFKLKKQFEGKKGEKLFELQTKFHSDSRFKMDEKFVDDTDDFVDSKRKYAREELKERKKLRKEMANWDQDELKEERDNQLSILESITGESTGTSHKPAQKGMLRFDPSKKDHQKYLDVVKGDEDVEEDDDDEMEATTADEKVSDERYFEVSDNLADAFKVNNSSAQPFSIFGMLGINHEEKVDENEKAEATEIKASKLPTKIQAIQQNQARFKYDSSDTDEEAESRKKVAKKEPQKKSKDGKYTKSGVWRFNFFVCDGDKRLQEAFSFLKKSDFVEAEVLQEKRKKLKKVIKTQVRKARHDKEKSSKKRKV